MNQVVIFKDLCCTPIKFKYIIQMNIFMKASDYMVNFLESQGVKHVFLITGGVIANFIASFRQNPNIDYICTEHEQAAAMAAEAYSRVTKNLGVAAATSGPGALNLMTGIACAYFDSIPTLFIAGQVNNNELTKDKGIRQFGFQEADVAGVAKPLTKMSVQINNPEDLRYYLEKAVYIAKSGRPGPVFLDVPNDVQRAEINPDELRPFVPEEFKIPEDSDQDLDSKIYESIKLISEAKRPLLILGAGIKLSRSEEEMRSLVDSLGIPFTLTWGGMDLYPASHSLFTGGFGVSTTRSGNFAVQNADLIVSIGARLDGREIGSKPKTFAREAKKVVVDIDEKELTKYGSDLKIDIPIKADVKRFLKAINEKLSNLNKPDISEWVAKTKEWKEKYPTCLQEFKDKDAFVDSYYFMDVLSEETDGKDTIITDAGGNLTWTMQGYKVKEGQQLFSAFGHSPMGYSLPASIGASFAKDKGRVVCIIGDGGIQMNIQELQTIFYHKLPIKIFVMNNRVYGIIKQFQDVWMKSQYEATTPESGYSYPDFMKVAQAYGLKTENIENHSELRSKIKSVLAEPGPVLCNVSLDSEQKIIPKLEFGRPIEDLSPFLDREEFKNNMIVQPLEE
jgi:acetolactate synthase-1/2/3 large subunit